MGKKVVFLGLLLGLSLLFTSLTFTAEAQTGIVTLDEIPGSPTAPCTIPLLQMGDEEDSVYLLQFILKEFGYYSQGKVTGYYGRLTRNAVRYMQGNEGFSATGKVDSETAGFLNGLVRSEFPEECGGAITSQPERKTASELEVGTTSDLQAQIQQLQALLASLLAQVAGASLQPSTPIIPVPAPISNPSIQVTYPNGGESFTIGAKDVDIIKFSWTVNYVPKNPIAFLYSPVRGNVYSKYLSIFEQSPSFPGSAVPSSGQYKINICDEGTSRPDLPEKPLCDSSDNYFTIDKGGVSATVLSPNGGESWAIGSIQTIKWSPVSGYNYILADLVRGTNNAYVKSISVGNSMLTGQFTWQIPSDVPAGSDYKIYINASNAVGNYTSVGDYSDAPFSIVAAGTATKATDSDNSPDYTWAIPSPSSITPAKYPDLFVAGVGKGDYVGGGRHIFGLEPDPTFAKSTNDTFTTYYDHCASPTQLNEAFVDSSGKLGAAGIFPPGGYVCSKGLFVASTSLAPSSNLSASVIDSAQNQLENIANKLRSILNKLR